jgi:PAS domain S-box-containing protein
MVSLNIVPSRGAMKPDLDESLLSQFNAQHYVAEAQRLSHVGSWSFNANGFGYWSPELFKIYGLDPGGKAPSIPEYLALVHPDDRDVVAREIEKMLAGAEGFDFKKRIVRPDGTIRHVRCVGALSTHAGAVQEFIGTGMDVTEQELLTQELGRREAYLAEAQSISHTGSFGWKPDTGEIIWSAETYRIFEYDRAITPTLDLVAQRVHPEDRADVQSVIERASRGASDFEHAYRLLLPDSRVKHVHALAHATRDASGNREFVGAVIDMTDHKRAEESLRASETYLAEAQRLSHTGSWAWSPDQDIRYWSEECYRVLSFDPKDGLPRFEEFVQRIHPDDQPGFRELIQTAIREKGEWKADYRIVYPDGPVRDIHVVGHPVLSTSGHLVEFVGTVIDVTEIKQAEEERKEHLWFLESMDRVNRAMQRTNDMEGMMSGVLEEMLAIFDSDRARLVYPCDPDAVTCRVVMEHSRPEYPGAFALGEELTMDRHAVEVVRRVLDSPGTATDLIITPEVRERFRVQSAIAIAVRPKADRPYLFGLHQCSHARIWTAAERRLFEEIARRLEDTLTSVLAHRNVIAREEELRASEERFRTFVEQATDAFILYDENAIVHDVNHRTCEALGYTREELIGMHVSQFAADSTPEKIESLSRELLKRGTVTYHSLRRRKDGSVFPNEVRARVFYRGDRPFSVALATDITERRRREQRLLAQFRVTQTLSEAGSLEKAALGILCAMCEALEWNLGALWQVDPEVGVLRCIATWAPPSAASSNFAAATRAISFGPGMGLPGRVWSSGGPVCIRDVALDPELPRAKSAAKEGFHAAFAFPITLKSGIVGVIELFSREVRDADSGLLQMMAAIGSQVAQFIERTRATDALRDAREKVAQASKIASLAELSASIAHEINQPLQAIVANGHASLRWLDATPPNIEKAIHTAKRVVRDGNAAAEVVSRIRALFKHAAPAKVDLDINKLILQVRTLMADEIQSNGVLFETELGEDLPRIGADAVQIQQVIVNLVRNAIEAMAATIERPKPLWIRSRREGDNVVVDIQDHGVGLADFEKIFEPFMTTKETGLGMGLAICRSIIEAHAGRIWVARNPERGVTFSFSLPIENSVAG